MIIKRPTFWLVHVSVSIVTSDSLNVTRLAVVAVKQSDYSTLSELASELLYWLNFISLLLLRTGRERERERETGL